MKRFQTIFLFALIALIWAACEDDKETLTLDMDQAIPAVIVSPEDGSSIVLTKETGRDTFEIFSWTPSEFGISLPSDYSLQILADGNYFMNPKVLYSGSELEFKLTNAEMNLSLYDAGAPLTSELTVGLHTAFLKTTADTLVSEPITMSITRFDYNKPTITKPANGTSYTLTKADKDNNFDTFEWDLVDYGADFSARYEIEFDLADNNFEKPAKFKLLQNENKYTPKVSDLNEFIIKKFKITGGNTIDLKCRVKAEASVKSGVIISEPINMTIKTYGEGDEPQTAVADTLWVPGDYQGWSPKDAPILISVNGDGIYVGDVTFSDDAASFEFKFTSHPNWENTNYGNGGEGLLDTSNEAGNLTVPEAGTYTFNVNTDELTWTYTKQ